MRRLSVVGALAATLPLLMITANVSPAHAQAESEPNNSIATADTLLGATTFSASGTVGLTTTDFNDLDYFSFIPSVSAGYVLNLFGTGTRPIFDPALYLFNSTGTLIGFNDDISLGSPANLNSAITINLIGGATYFAAVGSSSQDATPFIGRPYTPVAGGFNGTYGLAIAIPEPGTYALIGAGLLPLAGVVLRRRKA